MMTAPAPDQDQGVDPATGQISPAVLDAVIDQTDQRRAERKAEAEQAKATAYTCSRCGAGVSWRGGKGVWFHDAQGAICSLCDLDRRSFQQPDGAIVPDSEHRTRVILDLIGEERARWQYEPILRAKARDVLAWFCETPGARPGPGPERFGYVDVEALDISLKATPQAPAKRYDRGRRHRCPCGCKGACWTVEQVGVPAPVSSTGELSAVVRAHFRLTWTCVQCRRQEVETRAEQHPDAPVLRILSQ